MNAFGASVAFCPVLRVFHVERLSRLDSSLIDLVSAPRRAKGRKLAVQRRDHKLDRVCRHLADEAGQSLVVQLGGGVVE